MIYLMYIGNLMVNFAIFNFISMVLFKRDEMDEVLFISILVSYFHTYHEIKTMNVILYMVLVFLSIIIGGRFYRKFMK